MLVTGTLSALFILGGLLIPRHLGPVERAWMGTAHAISRVTSPVFLGVVFFGVFLPIGWIMRRVGRGPMPTPAKGHTAWLTRAEGARQSALDHQF
jgi:Saxitoxin biosynthesis operon protein SxtJ